MRTFKQFVSLVIIFITVAVAIEIAQFDPSYAHPLLASIVGVAMWVLIMAIGFSDFVIRAWTQKKED